MGLGVAERIVSDKRDAEGGLLTTGLCECLG